MFEQSLYAQETVAAPTESGDLFHNYEIKSWDLSKRIYQILGVSAAANILAILIVAQGSLLTMKGCDSPLVSRVCEALDVVYVGAMLFGTDREYIDAAYEKTDLADADITFVDVSGVTPPLSYPEGYFQIANPLDYQAMLLDQESSSAFDSGFPPGIPLTTPLTGNSVTDTTPIYPKLNPKPFDGDLPKFNSSGTTASNPPVNRRKSGRGGRVNPTPDDIDDAAPVKNDSNANTAVADVKPDPNKKVEPTAPVNGIDINKRPFVNLATNVNDLLDKKQFKLESAFVVNAIGKLTKDGKLDPKSFRWGQVTSQDQKMIDVVKEAIAAINDSGYLQYLKDISGKDFNLMLKQDETSISAVVQSEMESDTRAKSISSGLSLLISAAKLKKNSETADQNDKDDLILLENAKVETDGKKVVIKFLVPKDIALPMIQRKLAEQKAQPKQPNGNTNGRTGDNSAQK